MDVRASASLLAFPRVGFVVPRYKRSAVLRNRLKRRLREIVRLDMLTMLESLPPCDVVIRAFPPAYERDFASLRAEVRQAFQRLQRGGFPGGLPGGPSGGHSAARTVAGQPASDAPVANGPEGT